MSREFYGIAIPPDDKDRRIAELEAQEWKDKMTDVAGRNRERAERAEAEVARFRDEVVPQVEKKRHDAMAEVERLRLANDHWKVQYIRMRSEIKRLERYELPGAIPRPR